MKNPLTLAGIEPATFQYVAQHLNHCATAVIYCIRWFLTISINILYKVVFNPKHMTFSNSPAHGRDTELKRSFLQLFYMLYFVCVFCVRVLTVHC